MSEATARAITHMAEKTVAMEAELARLREDNERLREETALLAEALRLAIQHLDWIGWGDSWERECVRDSGDMAKINAARAKVGVEK